MSSDRRLETEPRSDHIHGQSQADEYDRNKYRAESVEIFGKVITLSVHDNEASSNILINKTSFADSVPHEGVLLRLRRSYAGRNGTSSATEDGSSVSPGVTDILFRALFANDALLVKTPNLHVSVPQHISSALHLMRSDSVRISSVNEDEQHASTVEISFRDQYLTRGDMWRLIMGHLCDKCIYVGQVVEFLSTIRVTIKRITISKREVSTALFHSSTKPVFRSEAARFVLFVQMSREMWDFDTDGTGEIMFDKVVNGFLPDLFRHWHRLQVHHILTVVLFSRVLYGRTANSIGGNVFSAIDIHNDLGGSKYQDYYRVVASDAPSSECPIILERLRKEFQNFARDITIKDPEKEEFTPLGSGLSAASTAAPDQIIAGRICAASEGNVLEAINLASSQFTADYIDRDLVRTTTSIIVISPGTGIFKVDHSLLINTTEVIVDSGTGIDLVCLSRKPLHRVPLFVSKDISQLLIQERPDPTYADPSNLIHDIRIPFQTEAPSQMRAASSQLNAIIKSAPNDTYFIPHWINVMYWASSNHERNVAPLGINGQESFPQISRRRGFRARIRMYELQMMGAMEVQQASISIPRLRQDHCLPSRGTFNNSAHRDRNKSDHTSDAGQPRTTQVSRHVNYADAMKIANGYASEVAAEPRTDCTDWDWMNGHDENLFTDCDTPNIPQSSPINSRLDSSFNCIRSDMHQDVTQHMQNDTLLQPSSSQAQPSSHAKTGTSRTVRARTTKSRGLFTIGSHGLEIPAVKLATAVADTSSICSYIHVDGGSHASPFARPLEARKVADMGVHEVAASHAHHAFISDGHPGITQAKATEIGKEAAQPIAIKKSKNHMANMDWERAQTRIDISPLLPKSNPRVPSTSDRGTAKDQVCAPKNSLSAGCNLEIWPLVAPWTTMAEPCRKRRLSMPSSRYGLLQQVSAQSRSKSLTEWHTLCCPLALPLTTEHRPTPEQIATEYDSSSYTIILPSVNPDLFAQEMFSLRLARGFQMVVDSNDADSVSRSWGYCNMHIFDSQLLINNSSSVILTRGRTVHYLHRIALHQVNVSISTRKENAATKTTMQEGQVHYKPLIRSMLAGSYEEQDVCLLFIWQPFEWRSLDDFVVKQQKLTLSRKTMDSLRPWSLRFVLAPGTVSTHTRSRDKMDGDTDEEVRLEGIQRLSQVWQRHSFGSDYRKTAMRGRSQEDFNPLEIKYFTRNASRVLVEEHEFSTEETQTEGSLPSQEFISTALNLEVLAMRIQSVHGLRLVDRRWHWKLHRQCFIGSEMTGWLLEVFQDVHDRSAAVDLGNTLMKAGLFRHVEHRHDFRDGNYFYQIQNDYRIAAQDYIGGSTGSRGATPVMLARPDSDVSLNRKKDRYKEGVSHVDSDADLSSTTKRGRSQNTTVALGNSLVYNLDSRHQRSYREELIYLHYDSIHNPENCYHFRLEWLNATPKLIQDAVVEWSRLAEAYGLRMVEVPIDEAAYITDRHPFRAPYVIKLALDPPEDALGTLDGKTFDAQGGHHYYQKVILQHFGFVLDMEAISAYPDHIDVSYSWGRPNYDRDQYMHRTGLLIAQITNSGKLLIIANRLYNNRSSSLRIKQESEPKEHTRTGINSNIMQSLPLRGGDELTQRRLLQKSPVASPTLRAHKMDSNQFSMKGYDCSDGRKLNDPASPMRKRDWAPVESNAAAAMGPEPLTRQLHEFCNSRSALAVFYANNAPISSRSGPSTPIIRHQNSARWTPRNLPKDISLANDMTASIPDLVLPASISVELAGART